LPSTDAPTRADQRRRIFLDRSGRPRLASCAVLFMDVLGVRHMTRGRTATQNLRGLSNAMTLWRHVLREDSPWPAAFFSDTLVLAYPVGRGESAEAAVTGLAAQAGWLQLELVRRGFFVRGALTLGKFHIYGGLIFGPALVEAYELEQRAVQPRIVLGEKAEECQRAAISQLRRSEQLGQPLLRDYDGHTFIDYLALPLESPEDPTDVIRAHRDVIRERLREHRGERATWEKYRWAAEYHNQVVGERLPDGAGLAVPEAEIGRRFLAFS